MPEGDTIWRTAGRLRPALAGHELLRFEALRLIGDRPRLGGQIDDVEAVGKHLLVHFAGGLSLDTHMRMTGSWHLYRVDERWRKASHLVRCIIGVDGWNAVCFSAPIVRSYRRDGRAGPLGVGVNPVARLGPDLCRADVDLDSAVERFSLVDPHTTIAEALLDQTVAAGIGNVYKAETLFACGVDPFVTVEVVDEAMRRHLLTVASRLLRRNLGSGSRTTTDGPVGELAVYGRTGLGCRRCGTPIKVRRHGRHARSTWWCPTCQPAVEGAPRILR